MDIQELYDNIIAKYGNDKRKANVESTLVGQVLAFSEESGELMKELRTYLGFSRKSRHNASELGLEMADVYITLTILSMMCNIDLENAVYQKLDIIERRGGI